MSCLRVTEAVAGGGGGHARFWSSVSYPPPSLFRSSSSCQVPIRESRFKLQMTSGKLQTNALLIGNTNRLEIRENTKRPKRKYKQHQLPSVASMQPGGCGRANSTKNPESRIDPRERPADPDWTGKEGTTIGIKNEENPRSVGPKNPLFFLYSPINAEPGEQRSLHRYL